MVWRNKMFYLIPASYYRQKQILFYSAIIFTFLLLNSVRKSNSSSSSSSNSVKDDSVNIKSDDIASIKDSDNDVINITWDTKGPQHKFWPSEATCDQFMTRFSVRHSLPTRALVSYPGSGNTWIRYLIEAASGVYTGSIFRDKSILAAGHHGEARNFKDGSTILQKTHHRALYVDHYQVEGWKYSSIFCKSFLFL